MEERMLVQARAGAQRLTRADAARALGADQERLVHAPVGHPHDALAAAMSVLSDGRLVSVISAPAGSGKTLVLAEDGRAWAAAALEE